MKQLLIFIVFYLSIGPALKAQEEFIYFNKTFWADTMNTIAPAVVPVEDGYLVLGNYVSVLNGQEYIYLRKVDEFGETLWVKEIDNENVGELNIIGQGGQLIKTKDKEHILLTYSKAPVSFEAGGNDDVKIVKLDLDGNLIWEKEYLKPEKGEVIYQIIETNDGGIVLGGVRWVEGNATSMYLMKVDSEGNFLWEKEYNPNWGKIFTIQQTWWDEGYIFSGWSVTDEDSSFYDMHIVKVDKEGVVEWEQVYGGNGNDVAAKVVVLTNEDNFEGASNVEYLLVGAYDIPGVLYENQHFSAKLNADGEMIWQKFYPELTDIIGFQTYPIIKNGKFIMNGLHFNENGVPDNLLAEFLLETGDLLWTKELSFNPTEQVYFKDMEPTPDGGYILAGYEFTGLPQKGWLVKIDALGNTCQDYDCDSTAVNQVVNSIGSELIGASENSIKIGPNPFNDYLEINSIDNSEINFSEIELFIYSIKGILIKQEKININSIKKIKTNNLLPGIYLYELRSANKIIKRGKLVK